MVACAQGLHGRLDDMVGGEEIRLSDAQVDDGATFGLQRFGPGQHLERGFGAQSAHGGSGFQHVGSPDGGLRWLDSPDNRPKESDAPRAPATRHGRRQGVLDAALASA